MKRSEHHLLLVWLLFSGIVVFTVVVSYREGWLWAVFVYDKSKICIAIGLLYVVATFHCARRTVLISTQINRADRIGELFEARPAVALQLSPDGVKLSDQTVLPDSIVSHYIGDLLRTSAAGQSAEEGALSRTDLLDVYSGKIRSAHEIGWFMVDILLKLGLLGTIVGFILMLGSVADTTSLDVSTMQKVLAKMSTGMGTALYTTLAGLVGSMLLALQYHFLDRGADELIGKMLHLTEVYVLPKYVPLG